MQGLRLEFKSTMDMDIGLKYQALNQGKIDVMVIFTTDGQLSVSDASCWKTTSISILPICAAM